MIIFITLITNREIFLLALEINILKPTYTIVSNRQCYPSNLNQLAYIIRLG
jgi:hypothetical protein